MKKIVLVFLLLITSLTGCDSTKKFAGMNADYKSVDFTAHLNGKSFDASSNGGAFLTIKDMKDVQYRAGKNIENGTISKTEINGNEIKCEVNFPNDTTYGYSYLVYNLDNPDNIQFFRMKAGDTDINQTTVGMSVNYVKKAEGEPDRIRLTSENSGIYIDKITGNDMTKKSQKIKIKDGQVTDANNYYYLSACNGYDKLYLDVTIKGKEGYSFENVVVTATLSGKILNPWATLESLGSRVAASKKKTKTVTASVDIKLDENGNGTGTIVVPGFAEKLSLANCITDYDLEISWSFTGTVIRNQ